MAHVTLFEVWSQICQYKIKYLFFNNFFLHDEIVIFSFIGTFKFFEVCPMVDVHIENIGICNGVIMSFYPLPCWMIDDFNKPLLK